MRKQEQDKKKAEEKEDFYKKKTEEQEKTLTNKKQQVSPKNYQTFNSPQNAVKEQLSLAIQVLQKSGYQDGVEVDNKIKELRNIIEHVEKEKLAQCELVKDITESKPLIQLSSPLGQRFLQGESTALSKIKELEKLLQTSRDTVKRLEQVKTEHAESIKKLQNGCCRIALMGLMKGEITEEEVYQIIDENLPIGEIKIELEKEFRIAVQHLEEVQKEETNPQQGNEINLMTQYLEDISRLANNTLVNQQKGENDKKEAENERKKREEERRIREEATRGKEQRDD